MKWLDSVILLSLKSYFGINYVYNTRVFNNKKYFINSYKFKFLYWNKIVESYHFINKKWNIINKTYLQFLISSL